MSSEWSAFFCGAGVACCLIGLFLRCVLEIQMSSDEKWFALSCLLMGVFCLVAALAVVFQ